MKNIINLNGQKENIKKKQQYVKSSKTFFTLAQPDGGYCPGSDQVTEGKIGKF